MGRLAEERAAKQFGARLTPASGSTFYGAKEDYETETYLFQNKATEKDSISIKRDDLHKVSHHAGMRGRHPVLSFQFCTANGQPRPGGDWVAIPRHVFLELIEKVNRD